eukprot:gene44040-55513_t
MSGTSFDIAYGRGHRRLTLPAGAEPTLIRKKTLPKLPDQPA